MNRSVRRLIRRSAVGLLAGVLVAVASAQSGWSTIDSNFNGTAIAAGNTVWFNSVVNLMTNQSSTVHVWLRNSTVTFGSVTVTIPDADITFLPTGTTGTINFGAGKWTESVSTNLAGSEFLSGGRYTAPAGGIAGGQNPVSWTGQFFSDTANTTLQWKWAAAVYTSFNSDLSLVDVKPVDANNVAPWSNSDHAGTPEAYKSFVIGGARGGGGSNFTGSYSGTASVTAAPVPEPASLFALSLGAIALMRRRRQAKW